MVKGFVSRRSSDRVSFQTDVRIQFAVNDGEPVIATTTNLSADGVRFYLPRGVIKLAPEEVVELVFNIPNHSEILVSGDISYFSNAYDADRNPVIYYGVKFRELPQDDWNAINDFVQSKKIDEPEAEAKPAETTVAAPAPKIETQENFAPINNPAPAVNTPTPTAQVNNNNNYNSSSNDDDDNFFEIPRLTPEEAQRPLNQDSIDQLINNLTRASKRNKPETPQPVVVEVKPEPIPEPQPVVVEAKPEPIPEPQPVVVEVKPEPIPEPQPVVVEVKPEPIPEPQPVVVEVKPEPIPEPQPVVVEVKPEPIPEPQPVVVEVKPEPIPEPQPVVVEAKPEPIPEPQPVVVEAKPEPIPEPQPVVVEVKPEPIPEPQPVVAAKPVAASTSIFDQPLGGLNSSETTATPLAGDDFGLGSSLFGSVNDNLIDILYSGSENAPQPKPEPPAPTIINKRPEPVQNEPFFGTTFSDTKNVTEQLPVAETESEAKDKVIAPAPVLSKPEEATTSTSALEQQKIDNDIAERNDTVHTDFSPAPAPAPIDDEKLKNFANNAAPKPAPAPEYPSSPMPTIDSSTSSGIPMDQKSIDQIIATLTKNR